MQTKTLFRSGAALLGAVFLLAACSKPAPSEEPIRSVKVLTVGMDGVVSRAEFSGEVRPRVESRLGFRVGGKIMKRLAEPGQRVTAGQLLAQLDPQDYKLAADAARAQFNAAATNRDLAQADFKRFRELKEQNFISSAELERRETTLKAAQAQLEQAQAQLASQGNQAGYANLLADVSGVITAVEAEAGQVVAAGTPVVRIAQDGPRDVVFSVPEDKLADIRPGSSVEVRLWASDVLLTGKVREVGASADPVTRTFLIKVSLDSKDTPPLGATVSVRPPSLQRTGMSIIKLPTTAIKQDGQTSAVWVLDPVSMTVKSQPVQIATADGNEVVITSGLQPGMQVVSTGVHVLSPGQKVTIFKDRQAAALDSKAPTVVNPAVGAAVSPTASQPAAASAK